MIAPLQKAMSKVKSQTITYLSVDLPVYALATEVHIQNFNTWQWQ